MPLFDVVLSDATLSAALAVDVVVQVGGRLVSKRLQALVASASTALVQVDAHGERMDPDHCVTHRLHGDVACVLDALRGGLGSELLPRNPLLALCEASLAAEAALQQALADKSQPRRSASRGSHAASAPRSLTRTTSCCSPPTRCPSGTLTATARPRRSC